MTPPPAISDAVTIELNAVLVALTGNQPLVLLVFTDTRSPEERANAAAEAQEAADREAASKAAQPQGAAQPAPAATPAASPAPAAAPAAPAQAAPASRGNH